VLQSLVSDLRALSLESYLRVGLVVRFRWFGTDELSARCFRLLEVSVGCSAKACTPGHPLLCWCRGMSYSRHKLRPHMLHVKPWGDSPAAFL
jgi:hypothetical protein